MFGRSVREERPDRPFSGFKLAQAVFSADGRRAGFAGLSIGARRVYGVVADASCVWNPRHAPPKRLCGCGFYCLDTLAEARALSCATENKLAVLLEVVASGNFIRYERGLRYSRQRVRAVRTGRCVCGRPATGLADAGRGFVGWRCLAGMCAACAGDRPTVAFGEFTARLDGPVSVEIDASPDVGSAGPTDPTGPTDATGPTSPTDLTNTTGTTSPTGSIAILTAEIALVQARLDDLQARVARHERGTDGAP